MHPGWRRCPLLKYVEYYTLGASCHPGASTLEIGHYSGPDPKRRGSPLGNGIFGSE